MLDGTIDKPEPLGVGKIRCLGREQARHGPELYGLGTEPSWRWLHNLVPAVCSAAICLGGGDTRVAADGIHHPA